jgi:hypothetical protein
VLARVLVGQRPAKDSRPWTPPGVGGAFDAHLRLRYLVDQQEGQGAVRKDRAKNVAVWKTRVDRFLLIYQEG